MKNLITMICTTMLLVISPGTYADDHTTSGPLFYGQSIGIVATDAPAVLAAMDKWRNSATGKNAPNTVVLLQNIVNGDYQSTHGINIFYANGAAMDAAAELYAGSKDWSAFQNAFQSLVETEWENTYAIMRAKANAGDVSSSTPVSIVYGFTVTDPAGFMSAFDKMWNSEVIQNFPGGVYFGQNIAAGTVPGTHFVTFVADTRGKLTEAIMAMQNSNDMAAYMQAVGSSRKVEAINMFSEVQRWSNGG
tara:strand:+ start:223 stop:966 length:744 start_codon:yes stop_codon:yes gene_type:complete